MIACPISGVFSKIYLEIKGFSRLTRTNFSVSKEILTKIEVNWANLTENLTLFKKILNNSLELFACQFIDLNFYYSEDIGREE